jgi:hypothetical protein
MRPFWLRMRWSRTGVLGGLCIALVLLSGMIQAAHFHASAQPDHDCSLCLTVHSVAHVATPIVLRVTSRPVAALAPLRCIARPRPAVHFRLASRPPPEAPSLLA